jgi:hypothetical protein
MLQVGFNFMSDTQTWVIKTDDLQVGTSLSFDLSDANGAVLLKAGMPIQERLKDILRKKNIHSVTVRGSADFETAKSESALLGAYPSDSIESIQTAIATTENAILRFVRSTKQNQTSDIEEIVGSIDNFIVEANKDIAATLALIGLRPKGLPPEYAERLTARATKLSLLSIVLSVLRGDEERESHDIGMAGALHDNSLFWHPEWQVGAHESQRESYLNEYRRHPIESAEKLNGIDGVSKNCITLISQVHEQADGTGYPRGMLLKQMHSGSAILNLADAYLTLTAPIDGIAWQNSDSMAYLCYHTARGKFCTQTLQLLIRGISAYPIGSIVRLDDESKAIVVRSNPESPMQPIVRLLHDSHSAKLDLSRSKRYIMSPMDGTLLQGSERIKKSRIKDILWRTDH